MKKIFSYAMMSIAAIAAFTSCADDRDSNPTLTQPTTFVLNNPSVGTGVVDLAKSTSFDLTWSQPTEYTTKNAPVVATYTIQLSSKGTFEKEYDEDADDNSSADFISLDETTTSCSTSLETAAIAKKLQMLNDYPEEGNVLSEPLYIRVKSAVMDASQKEYYPIVSNVVNMNILPYYVELSDAPVEMWCILGNSIGDSKWTNTAEATGTSNFPFFMVDGYSYDKKTGEGELEIINYFKASEGFKAMPMANYSWASSTAFSWDYGLCAGTEAGTAVYRNAGDDGGNVVAPADGYYRFVINTAKKTAAFEPYTPASTTVYTAMSMMGSWDAWADDIDMTPVFTTENNHIWYGTLTVSDVTEFKFRADHAWDANWGCATFPTGMATQNGNNIKIAAGSWDIMFNDLTGAFSITAKQ